jgi:hypothetical protein
VESADRPFVKVLDFGLAKRIDSAQGLGLTGPRDSMGSPYYMSPEQIVHPLEVDARTDIWSLGVVLYRLLTGVMPFAGDTALEVYAHVINAEPVPPTQFRREIGQELEDIVQRCLRKDVSERYQSIQDLSQDLLGNRVQRQERVASGSTPTAFAAEDDTPITIPGVHSRWPVAVVMLLALGVGAFYQADAKGRVDARGMAERLMNRALASDTVRNVTDGWLTLPQLAPSADEPMPHAAFSPTLLGPSAGVFLADRGLAAEGSIALPAEREREASAPEGDGDDPASAAARLEKRAAEYQRYLKDNGMVPIKEVLEKLNGDTPQRAE